MNQEGHLLDQAMRKRDALEAGVWGTHRDPSFSTLHPHSYRQEFLTSKAESGAHMHFSGERTSVAFIRLSKGCVTPQR